MGIRQERRNFINNFLIKNVLIKYLKFKNYFFYDFFINNRWFTYKRQLPILNIFWRIKPSLIPYYNANFQIASHTVRRLIQSFFSSKIQIYRYEGWIIIIWYIYNKTFKHINPRNFKSTLKIFKKIDLYQTKIPLLYIKYYILYKLKLESTQLINYIIYVNYISNYTWFK